MLIGAANPSASADGGGPDPAALTRARNAAATMQMVERLAKDAASWTSDQKMPSGGRVLVDVLQAPGRRRLTLSIAIDDRRLTMTRVVERDGVWYVTDGEVRGKYRPFEAPTRLPLAYLYLEKSEPLFAVEGTDLGTFEAANGPIASYRTPLPAEQKRRLETVVRNLEGSSRTIPLTADGPRRRPWSRRRNLLARGIVDEVDTASGMLVAYGGTERRTRIVDFLWLDKVDDREFDVSGGDWADFTDDPTAGDRDNLILIGNNGLWQPGMRTGETDARLLDVATGRFRRVPFRGSNSVGGCFLRGRTRVAVTGIDQREGRMGLYLIDLRTGENRPLGGAPLAGGATLFPALSPDGKTLAVLHSAVPGRLLETRIYFIDIDANTARPVGEPRDMGFPSWLPDGRGLILLTRHPDAASGRIIETIARMDLDGRITPLLNNGTMPTLIGDGRTILFLDVATRTWQTSGLDGKDDKPYAGRPSPGHWGFPRPAARRPPPPDDAVPAREALRAVRAQPRRVRGAPRHPGARPLGLALLALILTPAPAAPTRS